MVWSLSLKRLRYSVLRVLIRWRIRRRPRWRRPSGHRDHWPSVEWWTSRWCRQPLQDDLDPSACRRPHLYRRNENTSFLSLPRSGEQLTPSATASRSSRMISAGLVLSCAMLSLVLGRRSVSNMQRNVSVLRISTTSQRSDVPKRILPPRNYDKPQTYKRTELIQLVTSTVQQQKIQHNTCSTKFQQFLNGSQQKELESS